MLEEPPGICRIQFERQSRTLNPCDWEGDEDDDHCGKNKWLTRKD